MRVFSIDLKLCSPIFDINCFESFETKPQRITIPCGYDYKNETIHLFYKTENLFFVNDLFISLPLKGLDINVDNKYAFNIYLEKENKYILYSFYLEKDSFWRLYKNFDIEKREDCLNQMSEVLKFLEKRNILGSFES